VVDQPIKSYQKLEHQRAEMEHAIHRVRREPLNYFSTVCFGLADVCALVSLGMPKWLTAESEGKMDIGLVTTCLTMPQRNSSRVCYQPDVIESEWILTYIFILIGILGLTSATIANIVSFFRYPYQAQTIARFAGLVAIIFFSLAQIIFPSAFDQDQVGGLAFQLPSNFKIGASYGLFFASHWLSVISELCATKICRPRWQF